MEKWKTLVCRMEAGESVFVNFNTMWKDLWIKKKRRKKERSVGKEPLKTNNMLKTGCKKEREKRGISLARF